MFSPFSSTAFDRAFAPMGEMLSWRQDKAPHKRGSFLAVVLHGESQSDAAGPSRGALPADPWSVHIPHTVALAAEISTGDTLLRLGLGAEVLTVQQITPDEAGWILRCTANMRSPRK